MQPQSILAANKLGAKLVEFDVQVTKDLVPVLYHDYSLSESGTDVPIHDVNLDQFMLVAALQSPQSHPPSAIGLTTVSPDKSSNKGIKRSRSDTDAREESTDTHKRLRCTEEYIRNGVKPNTRGDFIQGSFVTLEDVLRQVPEHIGFNVEIKYPRICESRRAGHAPIALELNTFIDRTLRMLERYAGARTIILSAFTPEVCILLALKQKAYPVLFITGAETPAKDDHDVRASSLDMAVRFVNQWDLAGIVVAAKPLVACPRLIGYVKGLGLVCASYGPLNEEPENVKIQADAGIDFVITDRVALISKSLEDVDS
ncbi:Glycerophosphodiester phosphodiesterase domain-containing protein [Massariosphaeria phaeospora]|uniref:Glycerophosphodiester phosphodiesterase domain-containing protein n=1 Tax=Massariosphaeria phaeospora TaxID=100035 RepID=A0A7C8IE25_9PLEO|nr:Glycerophosphodiester phosphodiesterase domain-containing protein [Massariosphaeria phaeospora]